MLYFACSVLDRWRLRGFCLTSCKNNPALSNLIYACRQGQNPSYPKQGNRYKGLITGLQKFQSGRMCLIIKIPIQSSQIRTNMLLLYSTCIQEQLQEETNYRDLKINYFHKYVCLQSLTRKPNAIISNFIQEETNYRYKDQLFSIFFLFTIVAKKPKCNQIYSLLYIITYQNACTNYCQYIYNLQTR